MLSTIQTVKEMVLVDRFVCTDGTKYTNRRDANMHEMLLRVQELFPDMYLTNGKKLYGKKFFFSRQLALECGIYTVILRDLDDIETLDYFMSGLDDELGYPEEDKLPLTIHIEIYYEYIPNAIRQHAQWRLYKDENQIT